MPELSNIFLKWLARDPLIFKQYGQSYSEKPSFLKN